HGDEQAKDGVGEQQVDGKRECHVRDAELVDDALEGNGDGYRGQLGQDDQSERREGPAAKAPDRRAQRPPYPTSRSASLLHELPGGWVVRWREVELSAAADWPSRARGSSVA